MKPLNYLIISDIIKQERVTKLQAMRIGLSNLMKKQKAIRATKTIKPRKRKPVFFSDKIERLFNSMSPECKDFILKGK